MTGAHTIVFVHCPVRSGDFAGGFISFGRLRFEMKIVGVSLSISPNKVGSGRFIDRFVGNIRFGISIVFVKPQLSRFDLIVLFPTFFGMILSCLL